MGALRYIGSKVRVVDAILDIVGPPANRRSAFVDLFSGTGTVSREAARRGWRVRANDSLVCASILTTSQLLGKNDVPFTTLGCYASALTELDATEPQRGFIFREYSPSGLSRSGHVRKYFSVDNAMKIDGIRDQIRVWREKELINSLEEALLVADLLLAANGVASIAGTYGCFLRRWAPNALVPIRLRPRKLLSGKGRFEVLTMDACNVPIQPADLAYLDPPYTKRQYAAYYHVLETIADGDCPKVDGVTGLRPWEDKSSPFCYKKRALAAFENMIFRLPARRVLISYSSEGHVNLADLTGALAKYGNTTVHNLGTIGRYRPNSRASAKESGVAEYVIEFHKRDSVQEVLTWPELCH